MFQVNDFLENDIRKKSSRIWELDLIRGIILILVTWDHIGIFGYCWNIIGASNAFGIWLRDFMFKYLASGIRWGFEPVLIWMLVLLSGINCTFSRNHTRRAAEMLALDLLIIVGHTILKQFYFEIKGETLFNILTIFSICFTLWVAVDYFKIKNKYLIQVALVLFAGGLYYYLRYRTNLIGEQLTLPENLRGMFFLVYNTNAYEISYNNFEPLLPSLGFFLLGGVFGRKFYKNRSSLVNSKCPKFLKPVIWTGRHSLTVFLLGAPVLVFFMWILSLIKVL